jgi:hypothetical protein
MPQFPYYERLSVLDDYFDRFSFRPRRLSRSARTPHVGVYSLIPAAVSTVQSGNETVQMAESFRNPCH